MIQKVTRYVAKDGYELPTKDAAIAYEDRLDLIDYINDNPLYSNEGRSIDGEEFALWLSKHPRVFVKLLPDDRPLVEDSDV